MQLLRDLTIANREKYASRKEGRTEKQKGEQICEHTIPFKNTRFYTSRTNIFLLIISTLFRSDLDIWCFTFSSLNGFRESI